MVKRAFDIFFSLFATLISLPLWLIITAAIWLEDGFPIFYVQERVGKDGVIFRGVKFRSMIKGAESKIGPVQARMDDVRITRVGKMLRGTALDELPQLLNILRGEMSFVGPRALRPIEADGGNEKPKSVWEFEGFKERSSVKPGLTGVAQLIAPRDVSRSEKFKYDIWYINNRSFRLDMYIMALSFVVTFFRRWEARGVKLAALGEFSKKVEGDIGRVYRKIA